MLDSLVRVSRRVIEDHFVRIANTLRAHPQRVRRFTHRTALQSKRVDNASPERPNPQAGVLCSSIQSQVGPRGLTGPKTLPSPRLSPSDRNDSDPPNDTERTHDRSDTGCGLTTHPRAPSVTHAKYTARHDWAPTLPS